MDKLTKEQERIRLVQKNNAMLESKIRFYERSFELNQRLNNSEKVIESGLMMYWLKELRDRRKADE